MKLMAMTPAQSLLWIIPGGIAGLSLLGLSAYTTHPAMNIAIASLGLLPSLVVLAWGTIKFRSY